MYTEGYTKQGKYPSKYDTTFKRNAHFNKELKFAHAKAETKAHSKSIRELAGLMTGYTAADLTEGRFIFAKVRKSKEALKLEQAANLSRISNSGQASPAANLLFGPEDIVEDTDPFDTEEPPEIEPVDITPVITPEEELLGIFQTYEKLGTLPEAEQQTTLKCIRFLESNPAKDESYKRLYQKVIDGLKKVELKIDAFDKVEHKFY